MYLDFYRLRELPFALCSEGRYFYSSDRHNEVLANMLYAVTQRKGLVMVTGEVGSGKTFLAAVLLNQLGPNALAIRISNPPSSGRQLLDLVARKIGLKLKAGSAKSVVVEELENELMHLLHRGRLVVLIIDEAQELSEDSMEELRLLWNWEDGGQRLIQILLIGQPELKHKLAQGRWEALRQRIALSCHLLPLEQADTERYVLHRLKTAASEGCRCEFTRQSLSLIHQVTLGVPRMINVLCDNALLAGYAQGKWVIDADLITQAMKEMTCWDVPCPTMAKPLTFATPKAGQNPSTGSAGNAHVRHVPHDDRRQLPQDSPVTPQLCHEEIIEQKVQQWLLAEPDAM